LRRQESADAIVLVPSHREGQNAEEDKNLSCSRDEHGKPTVSDRDTAGDAKKVKPLGHRQRVEQFPAQHEGASNAEGGEWERVWERKNLLTALKRVKQNGGAPGIDARSVTVKELAPYLKEHWLEIRAMLDAGTYQPQPVRRQGIPKPGGGMTRSG
jgi:retron-type reverse transcriptase